MTMSWRGGVRKAIHFCMAGVLLFAFGPGQSRAATVSVLAGRGYAVIPEPQNVDLQAGDFEFGKGWRVKVGEGVQGSDVAVESLEKDMAERFGLPLTAEGQGKEVELVIRPGSVKMGEAVDPDHAALAEQAYRLDLGDEKIQITANAEAGLFYGVETLVQLVKPERGKLWLPRGEIVDWPNLENRFIYWDDNHHLDRLSTLKNTLRQAAFYKINGFAIKLNGHFEFESAPAVVEPDVLSPSQLQELTDYGLRYHLQLIPYVDGPAHIHWILKHPEYAKLRAFPDSNYELCATNPASYQLLDGLYQDILDANKGSRYFVLSTDEPYYVGLAKDPQCDEQDLARQLGSVGKVLAKFVTKTAAYLHQRDRNVIFWGEYPLKPGDLAFLPSYLINGETYGPEFDPVFKARGIREMIYVSTEGEEYLFPNYYLLPSAQLFHQPPMEDRVGGMFRDISSTLDRQQATLTGVIVAGWGDNGLHPETFWLGYVTGTARGWNPNSPGQQEAINSFYRLFYGPQAEEMGRLYQLMSTQAEFYTGSWDWEPSTARKPIFGNSYSIFQPRRPARDQVLPLPPVPQPGYLWLPYAWGASNAKRVRLAQQSLAANDELLNLLQENLGRVEFNRYNLEVYLSIAKLYRQNLEMLEEIEEINQQLRAAEAAAARVKYKDATAALDVALDIAKRIRIQRNEVLANAARTWYQSWFPKVAAANGRTYLNVIDDVKDHLPGRTTGISYLIYRELQLPLGNWYERVEAVRNQYAQVHGMPARSDKLNWKNTSTTVQ